MDKPILQVKQLTDPKSIHAYYQNIIYCMPNNVYWLDRNCITQGCNENTLKLVGLTSQDQFIGISYEEMGHLAGWTEGQAASFKRDDMTVMATGVAKFNVEEPPLHDKEGNSVYYMSSRVPIFNENNEVIGVVGISVDITELKKIQEALKVALEKAEAGNRAKDAFILNMAHDIRTPLTGMIQMSEDLVEMVNNNAELLERAQLLEGASKRLHVLLEGVLELSKSEHIDEGEIKYEAVDLFKLTENLRDLILPSIKTKGLAFKIDLDSTLPQYLETDKIKLERILLNLTTNAIKFTEKGQISLSCRYLSQMKSKARLQIVISDTGIGIPADQLGKIFDRFVKVHPSYQGVYKGHGVGLFIVRQYVEALGGTIKVESILGQGTRFTIILPLAMTTKRELAHTETTLKSTPLDLLVGKSIQSSPHLNDSTELSSFGPRILLIEDDFTARLGAQSRLKKCGYKITIAETVANALKLLKEQAFDLVLTDIGLPDGSGMDLVKSYRELEKNLRKARTPIFAITGHAEEQVKADCIAAGIDQVFTKPLTEHALEVIKATVN